MPNFQVINRNTHASRRWVRQTNYTFAAKERIVALVGAEMHKAMMSMPLAFTARDEGYVPVAVLGLVDERNLYVAPNGQWLGAYVPAPYRAYPFRLARTPDGLQVLCVDEDGPMTEGADGEAFFGENGEPVQAVRDILDLLNQVEQNRVPTQAACALLERHGLLKPWLVTVQTEAGNKQLGGLFQVDEAALGALPADALAELRDAGALLIAYCQLLSMQHLQQLGALVQTHARAEQQARAARERLAPARELDLEFLNNGGTISFGNLG